MLDAVMSDEEMLKDLSMMKSVFTRMLSPPVQLVNKKNVASSVNQSRAVQEV